MFDIRPSPPPKKRKRKKEAEIGRTKAEFGGKPTKEIISYEKKQFHVKENYLLLNELNKGRLQKKNVIFQLGLDPLSNWKRKKLENSN